MEDRFLKRGKLLILILAGILCSCSVKEERRDCPCFLSVSCRRAMDAGIPPASFWENGLNIVVYSDTAMISAKNVTHDELNGENILKVRKGFAELVGMVGSDPARLVGHRYYYSGIQVEPLFLSYSRVDCSGEEAFSELNFNKQFSNVQISGLKAADVNAVVVGNSGGIDVLSGRAFAGKFSTPLELDDDGCGQFRLPRQMDDSISIMLYDDSGTLKDIIPLGQMMSSSGYDWDAESLPDVSVTVDRLSISITLSVNGWSQIIEFPYLI